MHKIVLAITGASGSIYAKLLIEKLLEISDQWQELSIVMTDNARFVWETEIGTGDLTRYEKIASEAGVGAKSRLRFFGKNDFLAPFASGSGQYNCMILAPCSMGTLGRIAGGISDDLITRAADVVLKERRKLIAVVRETPYNLVHIRNMETITLAGGIICPATPSFYSRPTTIEEAAATVVDRVIDLAGLRLDTYRWGSKGNSQP